jgi:hypothetical protein
MIFMPNNNIASFWKIKPQPQSHSQSKLKIKSRPMFGNLKSISFGRTSTKSKPKSIFPSFNFGFGPRPSNIKNIKKKDMNWSQAKSKYPKLSPFGDADRDGVKNMFDCKPFDKKRQDDRGRKDKIPVEIRHDIPIKSKLKYLIIDADSRIIQGGVRGVDTKKEAEEIMSSMIKSRSKRGQKSLNREFNRSLNMKIVEVDDEENIAGYQKGAIKSDKKSFLKMKAQGYIPKDSKYVPMKFSPSWEQRAQKERPDEDEQNKSWKKFRETGKIGDVDQTPAAKLNLDDFRDSDSDKYAVDKMAGYKAAKEAEREAESDSAISEFQSESESESESDNNKTS